MRSLLVNDFCSTNFRRKQWVSIDTIELLSSVKINNEGYTNTFPYVLDILLYVRSVISIK